MSSTGTYRDEPDYEQVLEDREEARNRSIDDAEARYEAHLFGE
ncbi:Uncharacterised protein (plasmid) [Tsukamurella tyrosinosolvens]|uniref:Uncharacterized protein n=1 Tax=Tsukamurella tyrosinosolvens TaxID=57704 RepID=A0A1H4V611_TSUTY|nr:hypothetical protein [Tsukamurella tyrosinosolvens]SEC76385.1 hypothetical protein SAMN04489793_3152 [Tsukamurella tyrosinosolvens]VEH90666.1 Uncharacterised protein [Tsukamurella tyrosinosolvens]